MRMPGKKTDGLLPPRSGALGHVMIMHNGQHGPDAEVDNAHHCQKSRQFTGAVKDKQGQCDCQQAKACEYPGRRGFRSHRAMGVYSRGRCAVAGGALI